MYISRQKALSTFQIISLGYIPRSGITGSKGMRTLKFLIQIAKFLCQRGYTDLYSLKL